MRNNYRYLHVFSMLFLMVMICDSVTVYKLIDMPFGYTTACALVFPFWFIISDIITEVYGSSLSKQILLAALVCELVFSIACYLLINIKSPTFWNEQAAFDLILGNMPRVVLSSVVAILISGYLNIYLVLKWKILLKGRYFWLRSIGASWIGEAFYTSISIFSMMYGTIPLRGLLLAILWSYMVKVVVTILLAGPASIIASFLKDKEGVDAYYPEINPFKV